MQFYQVFVSFMVILRLTWQAPPTTTNRSLSINHWYQKMIEGSMELDADPCEDFYQYACGQWGIYHRDAGDKYTEMLGMASYQASKELAVYMNKINPNKKPTFVRKVRAFYKSCMAVDILDHMSYVKWMQDHANLKWPILGTDRRKTDTFDWVRTLGVMRRYGLNGVLIEEVIVHKQDEPSKMVIDLDKPVAAGGFERLTYKDLKDLTDTLSVFLSSTSFETLWEEISDIEERLVKLNAIKDNKGNTLITVKDLPLPWLNNYLSTILNQTSLDPNMELYIQNIPYMRALGALLKEYKDYYICRYLGVRFLWHLYQNSPSDFLQIDCIDAARNFMPLAMHWIYEQQHPELREVAPEVHNIFANIRRQFNGTLIANAMEFSAPSVEYLLAKLNSVQLKVGNLPRIDTVQILESFYGNLTMDISDFHGNHLKLLEYYFQSKHSIIPNTLTTNISQYFSLELFDEGSNASPFYMAREKVVIVPFTALRQPVFHSDYDDVYKYSALGSVIAHEIFHCFDYTGLAIDGNGKTNASQYARILKNTAFNRNYKCLRKLNPAIVDEKIADISGLRFAFEAFVVQFPDAMTKTRMVNGKVMELTKLFFLNFAQYYCDSDDSDTEHGLASDRVNDALSYVPEFSTAYKCPRLSQMHPGQTCQLWR